MLAVSVIGFVALCLVVFVATARITIKGDPLAFGRPTAKLGPFEIRVLPWRTLPAVTLILAAGLYLRASYPNFWQLFELIMLATIAAGIVAAIGYVIYSRWEEGRRNQRSRNQWIVAPPIPHSRPFQPPPKSSPRPPEKGG
jgi:hypothetical protein